MQALARTFGVALVLLGLLANRWVLERFVLFDGRMESSAMVGMLAGLQLALLGMGTWLFWRAPRVGPPPGSNLLLLAFSSLLGLVLAEPAFRLLDPDYAPAPRAWVGQHANRESRNFEPDPVTGWRMRPSREFTWDLDDRITHYRSNGQGFRADRDFAATSRPVVAVAGDSFAWGVGVEREETFPALIGTRLARAEVRNFAMPGFGIDQIWMSVRHQVLPMHPALVIAAFIDDDFARSLTAYRPGEGLNKPKFRLVPGRGLVRETAADAPGPLTRWLDAHSKLWAALRYRVERLRPFGDWWELNLAMLARTAADCGEHDVPVLFVRMPQREQRGAFPVLAREMASRGLPFLDLGDRLGRRPERFYLATDEHMNAAGHARVAELLVSWIGERHPTLVEGAGG